MVVERAAGAGVDPVINVDRLAIEAGKASTPSDTVTNKQCMLSLASAY
jgi:hypothetical protein